jgi:hypothetical protein
MLVHVARQVSGTEVAVQEGKHAPDDLAGGVGIVCHVEGVVAVRVVDQLDGQLVSLRR